GGKVAVNGGFFGVDHAGDGLAVSEGRALSPFVRRMSGGVLWVREGVAHLTATEEYAEEKVDFAIQCRPRLIVGSKVNIKADDGKRARRTAMCVRDGGRTIELAVADGGDVTGSDAELGPTLFELATELASDGCEEALNLDGGPSTGWASRLDGGIVFAPPRAAVRHVVVVRD